MLSATNYAQNYAGMIGKALAIIVVAQQLNNRTVYLDFAACSLHSSNQPVNCNNPSTSLKRLLCNHCVQYYGFGQCDYAWFWSMQSGCSIHGVTAEEVVHASQNVISHMTKC